MKHDGAVIRRERESLRAPRREVVMCERKKEGRERRTKTANFATVMVVKLLTGSR